MLRGLEITLSCEQVWIECKKDSVFHLGGSVNYMMLLQYKALNREIYNLLVNFFSHSIFHTTCISGMIEPKKLFLQNVLFSLGSVAFLIHSHVNATLTVLKVKALLQSYSVRGALDGGFVSSSHAHRRSVVIMLGKRDSAVYDESDV